MHYVQKYNRFEKRLRNISFNLSSCFRDVSVDGIVAVGEGRPLTRMVSFNNLNITISYRIKISFVNF